MPRRSRGTVQARTYSVRQDSRDLHPVADRDRDHDRWDGEVIGCLNMLTRTYRTGRRQHYSRDREPIVTNKFITNSNRTHVQHNAQDAMQRGRCRRAVSGRLKCSSQPSLCLCQMRLQSHTQTHLNHTTKIRFQKKFDSILQCVLRLLNVSSTTGARSYYYRLARGPGRASYDPCRQPGTPPRARPRADLSR
jgi:hypothetical protein